MVEGLVEGLEGRKKLNGKGRGGGRERRGGQKEEAEGGGSRRRQQEEAAGGGSGVSVEWSELN